MGLNLFLLIIKVSDFMGEKKSFDQILSDMASKREAEQVTEKSYCERCGKFIGYEKMCRGGKVPTPEIKECDKNPNKY